MELAIPAVNRSVSAKPIGEPTRQPRQGRSKASFERMIAAAEALMAERGSDEFTLTDVAKKGKVSIGSIYLRFDSKADLVRAVQAQVLARMDSDQDALIDKLSGRSRDLDDFMREFVHSYAELLQSYAPLLRPMMVRATDDRALGEAG